MLARIASPAGYTYSSLALQTAFVSFAAFSIGVFVLGRELNSRVRISFFLLTAAISFWLFAFSRMYAAVDVQTAFFWAKTAYLTIAFIPAANYTFSAVLLRDFNDRRRTIAAAWVVSAVFCVQLLFTDTVFDSLYSYPWGYYPHYRPMSVPFVIYCICMITSVPVRLFRNVFRTSGVPQTSRNTLPVAIAFAGGTLAALDFAPAYGLDFYPEGYVFVFLFIIIAVYLMSVRRFPDIIPGVVASRVIETMQDALLVLDRNGIISLANRAACVLLGQEPGKLNGRRLSDNPLGNRFLLAEIEAIVRSGPEAGREITYPRQDGTAKSISISLSIIRDWTGETLFRVCVMHDITERSRLEQALEQSNAGLARQLKFTRTLLETGPIAAFFKDTEGRYLGCNEEFSKIVGVSPEHIKGKTVYDLWPAELASKYHEQDRALIENPGRQRYEFAVQPAQGNSIDVIFTKDVFTDERGSVQGIIGTFIDITDRKRAEEKIKSLNDDLDKRVRQRTAQLAQVNTTLQEEISERKRVEEELKTNRIFLHNILNSIQDPIVVLDRNRNILLANKTFEAVFVAKGTGNILGKSCHEVLFGRDEPCDVCLSEQSSTTRTVSCKTISTANGPDASRWYDVFGYPLFATDGRVVGNVHQLRDITEWKRAEETILKDQEHLRSLTHQLLTSEERERTRIARELHDEMGQMLTGIKLSLQNIYQLSTPDMAVKVGSIQQDIGDLMARMRDLSARLRPSLLDDLGLLPAVQWHIERFIKQTGMPVNFEHQGMDREMPHDVSLTLFRIMQEALTNAVRHSGAACVAITLKADERTASIAIRDQGAGFDLDEALNRGTTLGLAGMRERVEMAGGEITIRSGRDRGTEILCILPIKRQVNAEERSP